MLYTGEEKIVGRKITLQTSQEDQAHNRLLEAQLY